MLFSVAPFNSSHEKGVLMLLQKQWNASAAVQAENIFSGFTESFFRLRSDKEATKPYIAQYGSPLVSDLESASEICRRKLPERNRSENLLYFVVQDLHAEKLRIHFRLPRWIHLSFVNAHKGFFHLQPPGKAFDSWASFDAATDPEAKGDWSESILSFFDKIKPGELSMIESSELAGVHHYRMAEFLLRNQNPLLRTSFSICLNR